MMNRIKDFFTATVDTSGMPYAKNNIRTDGDFWAGAYPLFIDNER